MKIIDHFFFIGLIVLAFLTIISTQGLPAPNTPIDPFQEINNNFPGAIKLKKIDGQKSIEFCPDNTCDLFVARQGVSDDTLKDFAYLYIYFFSDYYVLNDWRKNKRLMLIAGNILTKPNYRACKTDNQKQAARCILRRFCRKNYIELYAVRYDENVRSVIQIDIFSATQR